MLMFATVDQSATDSATVWTAIQSIAVIITLLLIYAQIRKQSHSNVVQTLNLLSDKWDKKGLLVARARVTRAWSEDTYAFDGDACEIASYFEQLGTYVGQGLVGANICWEIFSYQIEGYYSLFEEGIKRRQIDLKDPSAFQRFTWLYGRMTALSRKRNVPFSKMNNAQFNDFVSCERKSAEAVLSAYELTDKKPGNSNRKRAG